MPKAELEIKEMEIDSLIPYVNNARTHSPEQVAQIAASIKEFGWTNPILIDGDGGVIAGHGRLQAARKLKMSKVPTICIHGLTEAQRKALIIADNKLAMNAGWDEKLLKIELTELKNLNYDLGITGFSVDELKDLWGVDEGIDADDDAYTKKIDAPTYTPSEEKPDLKGVYDETRYKELVDLIQQSDCTPEEKAFLILAAGRHVVFDYQKIADYYAHASAECQEHMENSALVIIDFNKAIEQGYVVFSEKINEEYTKEYPSDGTE